MNRKRRLQVANAYLVCLAVGFLPEPFVWELGTEQCAGWGIFLSLFLAGLGGKQMNPGLMVYTSFFWRGDFFFLLEVTEEQYNKKKRSRKLTLAFKCKLFLSGIPGKCIVRALIKSRGNNDIPLGLGALV